MQDGKSLQTANLLFWVYFIKPHCAIRSGVRLGLFRQGREVSLDSVTAGELKTLSSLTPVIGNSSLTEFVLSKCYERVK